MVSVKNLKKCKYGEFVCRPSPLGNPFKTGRDGTREEVIAKYRIWLYDQIKLENDIYNELLRYLHISRSNDLVLLCHCKPKSCHADIIKEWIDNQLAKEKGPINV